MTSRNYKYDVFVSYAHRDNEPTPDMQKGWVSIFIEYLKNLLDRKLGRDAFPVWHDEQLSYHEPFPDQISEALQYSATMLVVMSPK